MEYKYSDHELELLAKVEELQKEKEVAEKYKVFTIPTLIVFENGKEIKRKVGYQSLDELRKWVNDEE